MTERRKIQQTGETKGAVFLQSDHRSSLFLIELIVAIFFFALASAVCMQLFARAHTLQRETEDLNQGLLLAQSAAAVFESQGGDLAALQDFFPQGTLDTSGSTFTVLYGSNWEPLPETESEAGSANGPSSQNSSGQKAAYRLTAVVNHSEDSDSLRQAQITLTRLSESEETTEVICALPAAVQLPRSVPAESGQQEERP